MKLHLLSFVALIMAAAACSPCVPQDADFKLTDGWKIQSSEKIEQPWYDAKVPSTVLGTLADNGRYEDAFVGKNYDKLIDRDDFRQPWWYVKEFDMPALKPGQRVSLEFEGVSYKADVWFNGIQLASCDEMKGPFRQFSFDITDIAAEHNELKVLVHRAEAGDFNIGFVDWNPRAADESMGIFRPVWIRYSDAVSVSRTAVRSKVDIESLDKAWLTVETTLSNKTTDSVEGELRIKFEGKTYTQAVTLAPESEQTISLDSDVVKMLVVKNPRLWWCHNLGNPEMYSLSVSFNIDGKESDSQTVDFGIRQIESYMTEEGHRGFVLNGKKVLIKGAGWTDDIFLRNPDCRNDLELEYVKDMNLNTVRFENVWGTSQNVYDLCDRKGLLALVGWSCFWEWEVYSGTPNDQFGCIKTEEDMDLIAESFRDQVTWLRNHPSIIAWYVGSDMLPRPELEKRYLEVLDDVDDRPYVGSAKALNSSITGPTGMKMVGPYDYQAPSYWYSSEAPGGSFGFNTETGIGAQLPMRESIEKMIPQAERWPVGDTYDYHCTVAGEDMHSLDVLKELVAERYGEASCLDDFLRKAHHLDYDGTRAMFEGFRVNVPRSTGVIQWMLNSAWPSLYWQLYDWYLVPAASYWSVKKACAPQQLVYNYVDKCIYAVNDEYSDSSLAACHELYDIDGKLIASGEEKVNIPAGSSVKLSEIPSAEGNSFLFLSLKDKKGRVIETNSYLLSSVEDITDWDHYNWIRIPLIQNADFKSLGQMKTADVSYEVKKTRSGIEVTLVNNSDVVAFFLRLSAKDAEGNLIVPAFWSDNFFSLRPGETRKISCRLEGEAAVELEGWNLAREREDRYKVVAYYPSYRATSSPLSEEVLSMITHVNLSFAKVGADGNVDDIAVRQSMKVFGPSARKAGVKVLVSVGGGGGHDEQVAFATAIHVPQAREALVDNLMKLADEAGLDGLDIDYEAWNIDKVAPNEVLEKDLEFFLQMLRKRLGSRLLTAAVADYGRYNAAMAGCFDYVTVMAYDLTGPWTAEAGPHSPYEFFVSAVKRFQDWGFPNEKLVGGVPFYGRGYPGGNTKKAYEMTYSRIVDTNPGAENRNCIDDELYYDGFPAIDEKCRFVVENGLGGIMFWEVTGDSADPAKSLLYRITEDLRNKR